MGKLGYISIIFGVLLMIAYSIYIMLIDFAIPIPIKIALVAIIMGVVIIIVNLIIERRKEKLEEDDSSKY